MMSFTLGLEGSGSYKSKEWYHFVFGMSFHYYIKLNVDSCDFLPTEKILTLHNFITLTATVIYCRKNVRNNNLKNNDNFFFIV